ncbi:MAG: DNA repair protein RecO [Gammaproteobacteria bacterium]
MRVELHPCYILHSREYRETSLILEVFSAEHGRLGVVAKGGRKEKNNKRALMQPGREVNMAWVIRGEMGTLTAIESGEGHDLPAGGPLIGVFYMNELLIRLLHQHERHRRLFSAYKQAVRALVADQAEESVLRVFEKRLLESLGYGLLLEVDKQGNAIAAEQYYTYGPGIGPLQCPAGEDSAERYSGRTLLALAQEVLTEPICLCEAKRLTRRMLAELLGEKTLASRDLYRSYLQQL